MSKNSAGNKSKTKTVPKSKIDVEADKIDLITERIKKYQDTKIEMFKKSRNAILEQQRADLQFCKELDDFFKDISSRGDRR